jgi:hypothetical protein
VRDELQRVLELQLNYSSSASAEMVERGELIRNAIPASLLEHRDQLESALGINDFFSEGRDGTGRKTRVLGWEPPTDRLVDSIDLGDPGLGAGYESGNIFALAYEGGNIPADLPLLTDARALSEALGRLYAAHARGPIPHEQPELNEAEDLAEQASGSRKRVGRVGFRTNSREIKAVEMHAIALARAYYEGQGWTVKEFGKPFDLKVSKAGETLTVEVKGTAGDGAAVPLTAGEVAHHADAFPNNALVVVRGIHLTRDEVAPRTSGGTLFELRGWNIEPHSLRAISYAYEIPLEMYDHAGVTAPALLGGDDGD